MAIEEALLTAGPFGELMSPKIVTRLGMAEIPHHEEA